jgi:hypothetical protein
MTAPQRMRPGEEDHVDVMEYGEDLPYFSENLRVASWLQMVACRSEVGHVSRLFRQTSTR